MALGPDDPLPENLSPLEAYSAIWRWYSSILSPDSEHYINHESGPHGDYKRKAIRLIKALPNPKSVTSVEMKAVFIEVMVGALEFAYHEGDGRYKMAAYATVGLRQLGPEGQLSEGEINELQKSRLWPYLRYG